MEKVFQKSYCNLKKSVIYYVGYIFRGVVQSVEHQSPKLGVQSSSLCAPAKKFDKFWLVEFFYPLRKQWYIISPLVCISSPKVHIISRRLYPLSQWWYTTLRVNDIPQQVADDIHAFGVIWYVGSSPYENSQKHLFCLPFTEQKALNLLSFQ